MLALTNSNAASSMATWDVFLRDSESKQGQVKYKEDVAKKVIAWMENNSFDVPGDAHGLEQADWKAAPEQADIGFKPMAKRAISWLTVQHEADLEALEVVLTMQAMQPAKTGLMGSAPATGEMIARKPTLPALHLQVHLQREQLVSPLCFDGRREGHIPT